MPTTATDTDTFPTTVQRPNNGELADAASISQAVNPLTQRTRYAYNRSRSKVFDVTRAPYNADPTGATDAAPAIQAALDAASAAGGVVVAPGGLYRLDTGLLMYSGLALVGDPDRTRFHLNHASQTLLSLNSPGAGVAAYVDGIRFSAAVVNAATVVDVGSTSDGGLILHNCNWNGTSGNLQGTLVSNGGPGKLELVRCTLNVKGHVIGIVQPHPSGWLNIRGGRIVAPAAYGNFLVHIADGHSITEGVEFDLTDHASGGALQAFWASGIEKLVTISGCGFRGNGGLGTDVAIGADAGVTLVSAGHSYSNMEYTRFSTGFLANGSKLDLLASVTMSWSLAALPSVEAVFLRHTGATDPTITLPAKLFPGQEFTVTVFNGHGSATWTPLFTDISNALLATIDAGRARSWIFKVLHNFTGYAWVCVAGPTPQFVP